MSTPRPAFRFAPIVALLALPLGCGANANDSGSFANGSPTAQGSPNTPVGDQGTAPSSPANDGGVLIDAPVTGDANELTDVDTCYADTVEAERFPLAMYIMMDASGSMADVPQPFLAPFTTKWIAVKNALGGFVDDPASLGISVALQFFPLPASSLSALPTCQAVEDCGDDAVCVATTPTMNHCYPRCASSTTCGAAECLSLTSGDQVCGNDTCEVAAYTQPEVAFAALPGAQGSIMAAMEAHGPSTATPTLPALTGAIEHASQWALQHQDHKVIVVLATDGLPTVCPFGPSQSAMVQQVADVAAAGFNAEPSIRTFVIGLTMPMDGSAANLQSIASAGGTGQALIVQANADVTQQFAAALEQIRGAALACDFQIPDAAGGTLDYDRVNVLFSSGAVSKQTVYYVENEAACDPLQGGWYYDVAPADGTPTRILLCPASCDGVQNDGSARIDISIGCETQTAPK